MLVRDPVHHATGFRAYPGANPDETIVVKALEKILGGDHLSYDETRRMGKAILNGEVKGALKGAALIGQRMNLESYDEVRGISRCNLRSRGGSRCFRRVTDPFRPTF